MSLLLMIVSIAIAVLPVWRSPMISSRWPRPIGIIASIAFRPVCIGSFTGWRWTTPGALNSAGRVSSVVMSPLPSSGWPSGETMRPSSASPTGISSSRFVRLTVSPSTILSHGPNSTAPTLSDSRLSARPVTSCGSSSISKAMQFSRPWMRAMPSATDRTVPDLGEVGLALVEALDAALEDGRDLVGLDLHESPRPSRLACEAVRVGCGPRRRAPSCRPGRRCRRGCRAPRCEESSTLRPVCSAMRSPSCLTISSSSSTAEVICTGSSLFSSSHSAS